MIAGVPHVVCRLGCVLVAVGRFLGIAILQIAVVTVQVAVSVNQTIARLQSSLAFIDSCLL